MQNMCCSGKYLCPKCEELTFNKSDIMGIMTMEQMIAEEEGKQKSNQQEEEIVVNVPSGEFDKTDVLGLPVFPHEEI